MAEEVEPGLRRVNRAFARSSAEVVRSRPAKNPAAETFAAIEVPTGLRAFGVDVQSRAHGIQGDAGAVAVLIHAPHARCVGRRTPPAPHRFALNSTTQMAATAAAAQGTRSA